MQQEPVKKFNEVYSALSQITRQLDRLDVRTADLATRADLETLRKEMVARVELQGSLAVLSTQIVRNTADIAENRRTFEDEVGDLKEALKAETEAMRKDMMSRSDRLWIRLGQALAIAAFALALFEFLTHLRFLP